MPIRPPPASSDRFALPPPPPLAAAAAPFTPTTCTAVRALPAPFVHSSLCGCTASYAVEPSHVRLVLLQHALCGQLGRSAEPAASLLAQGSTWGAFGHRAHVFLAAQKRCATGSSQLGTSWCCSQTGNHQVRLEAKLMLMQLACRCLCAACKLGCSYQQSHAWPCVTLLCGNER